MHMSKKVKTKLNFLEVFHFNNTRCTFLSAFLRNCFLRWDCWNCDVTPTLDADLLCSSRAGSDLGLAY